ncbi:MAG: hypothetical protein ABJB66_10080 [Gemmatimonadaceae bacterium]
MCLQTVRRLTLVAEVLATFACVYELAAQAPRSPSTSQIDATDSAALARSYYRAAVERLTAGDSASAVLKLRESTLAWPLQPAYANALLTLSSRLHDSTQVEFALSRGNAIGVALANGKSDAARTLVRSSAKWALQVQDSLRAPIERSRTLHTLADSLLFPEGVAIDSRSGTLYVSSIFRRNIFRISSTGVATPVLRTNEAGVGSIMGVAVDTTRNLLWAVTLPMPLMDRAADSVNVHASLLAIRIGDGSVARRLTFPNVNAELSPGDLSVGTNGDVFVSDAVAGILWQLKNQSDSLLAIRHHLFHSLQGIIPSADGRSLWVADYSVGLLHVDLQTHDVVRVADAPGQTSVGIDGIVRYGDAFIAIQNAFVPYRIVRMTLDAGGTRIVSQAVIDQTSLASSPTGGAILGNNFVYVANSLWEGVDANGLLPATAPHPKPIILSLPLKRN